MFVGLDGRGVSKQLCGAIHVHHVRRTDALTAAKFFPPCFNHVVYSMVFLQAVDIKVALSLLTSSLPLPELATLNLLLALLQQHIREAGLSDPGLAYNSSSGGVSDTQLSPQEAAKAAAAADLWELWAQLLLAPPPAGAPSHVVGNRALLISGLVGAGGQH
jgi:hypothetical protein